MRPDSLLMLFFSAVSAWNSTYLPFTGYSGLYSTRIADLILDLDHDYIRANRLTLEGLRDPKEALCNPGSDLRKHIPPVPQDLFKVLVVDIESCFNCKIDPWRYAEPRFTEILGCPMALKSCEELDISIPLQPKESKEPSRDVPGLLARVLGSMPNLRSLKWIQPEVMPTEASLFKDTFAKSDLELPSVRNMTLGPELHFIIPLANNLETLSSGGRAWRSPTDVHPLNAYYTSQWLKSFLRSMKGLQHLTELHLKVVWPDSLIKDLQDAAPNLQTLDLQGRITGLEEEREWRAKHGSSTEDNSGRRFIGQRLSEMLPLLRTFEHLRNLRLPDTWFLDIPPYPESSLCGTMYFDIDAYKRERYEDLRHMAAQERASKLVLAELAHLESIHIGPNPINMDAAREGKPLWPWTGRVREYLLERWPRWPRDDRWLEITGEGREDPDGPVFLTKLEDEKWLGDKEPGEIEDWSRDLPRDVLEDFERLAREAFEEDGRIT